MTKKKRLFLVLTIAWLIFIFGHSMMPASVSGKESSGLLVWLQQFFPQLTHNMLRKMAHFGVFAVLGGLLYGLFRQYERFHPLKCVGAAFCAAFIDETIQIFVAGRSAQISDVWIDLGGAISAVLLICTAHHLIPKKRGT